MIWRLLIFVVVMLISVPGQAAGRFALLIGNQSYTDAVGALANPINDINLVEAALKNVGFQISRVENATLGGMYTALSAHTRRVRNAGKGAISFVYYSGHGAQDASTKTNYLIPVDVKSTVDSDLWDRSLRLSIVTRQLKEQASNATHFVVFDACRNMLKVKKAGTKSLVQSKGFVPEPKVTGMLVAYATANGETASDIGEGAGPYAQALAAELTKPGVEAVTMFRKVQVAVYRKMGQEPWLDFGYLDEIYLGGKGAPRASTGIPDKAPDPQTGLVRFCREVGEITSAATLEVLAEKYKGTEYRPCVDARIRELRRTRAANADRRPPASPYRDPVTMFRADAKPSFNCESYAKNPVGHVDRNPQTDLLCIDPEAASVDATLGKVFRAYLKKYKGAQRREAIVVQKRWILRRNGRCAATWDDLQNDQDRKRLAQCLLQATRERILDLR